ncbi:MAG: acyl-CoA desaturase [Proteobacteria bacterium]|nr:acyl-CoA desaturase [Pseudomonadota bacterium]
MPEQSPARSVSRARPAAGAWAAQALRRWFDTGADTDSRADRDSTPVADRSDTRIDWLRAAPFIALHLACLAVLWVGASRVALAVAAILYAVRMFAITAFYHRYFAHRTFRTSRALQFVFACLGASCVQRGPLWWAAHHRRHHSYADTERDPHSPRLQGFLWSHMGWFLTPQGFRTDWKRISDFARYPELRWLDRYDVVVPVALGAILYLLGTLLAWRAPRLGTSGGQLLTWGLCVSTVVLFHATVTINSLCHRFGTRRFQTHDDSRNNPWLALLTFGEGWHNNHHYFPGSARQGFRWWEVDLTYYGLQLLETLGLVQGLKPVPARVLRTRA